MSSTAEEKVRAMHALCDEIRESVVLGDVPVASLADLKSAIDKTRMWLWAMMEAAQSDDPTWVREFWLIRAADMSESMVLRLERGEIDLSSPRAVALRGLAERMVAGLTP